jgi:hypothetical protein
MIPKSVESKKSKQIPCIVCDGTKVDPDTGLACKECDKDGKMTVTITRKPNENN